MRPRQEEYAADGFLTAAIDLRYHGERAAPAEGQPARQVYEEALIRWAVPLGTMSQTE